MYDSRLFIIQFHFDRMQIADSFRCRLQAFRKNGENFQTVYAPPQCWITEDTQRTATALHSTHAPHTKYIMNALLLSLILSLFLCQLTFKTRNLIPWEIRKRQNCMWNVCAVCSRQRSWVYRIVYALRYFTWTNPNVWSDVRGREWPKCIFELEDVYVWRRKCWFLWFPCGRMACAQARLASIRTQLILFGYFCFVKSEIGALELCDSGKYHLFIDEGI